MSSPRTRQRQPQPAPAPAGIRRVSLVVQGTVEVYDAAGNLAERQALSERPLEIVGMSAAAVVGALQSLEEQVAAMFPPPAEPAAEPPAPETEA